MAVADPRPHRAQQPPVGRPWFGLHGRDEAVHHGADRFRLGKSLHGPSGCGSYPPQFPTRIIRFRSEQGCSWTEHHTRCKLSFIGRRSRSSLGGSGRTLVSAEFWSSLQLLMEMARPPLGMGGARGLPLYSLAYSRFGRK